MAGLEDAAAARAGGDTEAALSLLLTAFLDLRQSNDLEGVKGALGEAEALVELTDDTARTRAAWIAQQARFYLCAHDGSRDWNDEIAAAELRNAEHMSRTRSRTPVVSSPALPPVEITYAPPVQPKKVKLGWRAWFGSGDFLVPEPATKKCPDCAEPIRKDAVLCRYCGFRYDA